jgi:hypothetical protein
MFKLIFFLALLVFAGLLVRRFASVVAHYARGDAAPPEPGRSAAPGDGPIEKDVSSRARIIEENSNDGR